MMVEPAMELVEETRLEQLEELLMKKNKNDETVVKD